MSIWTLQHNGVEKSLAAWGLAEVKLTLHSQATDTLTFRVVDQPLDAPPLFAYGQTISLARAGIRGFVGVITQEPRQADGSHESLLYTAAGPWWHLSDLTYQQKWSVKDQQQAFKSRVILGQNAAGQPIHSGQALAEAVNYAIAAGRPLALGIIDPATPLPQDEHKDITCAEAITRILSWHPDAVTFFDYTTLPYPTLHIRKKSSLPAIALDLNAGNLLSELEIAARDDLVRSAVVVHFEISGITASEAWTNIVTDAFPPGSTGTELGAMVVTVPLDGPTITWVEQRVATRPIEENPASAATLTYWKKLVPALAAANVTALTFEDLPGEPAGTKVKRRQADPDEKDKFGNPVALKENLANELVEGGITDWMRYQLAAGLDAQYQILNAYISYWLDGVPQAPVLFSHQLAATSATTQTYSMWQVDDQGDPVPVGIAQALYESLGALQFEGHVSLVEEECTGSVRLGQTLNLTGGRPEWEAMKALVQEVELVLDTSVTRIHFGPKGKQRGASDLRDLMRVTRPSIPGRMADGNTGAGLVRATAKPKQLVGLGVTQVNSNTTCLATLTAGGFSDTDFPFHFKDSSGGGHPLIKISLGSIISQAGGYQTPIFPKIWNGVAWLELSDPSTPLLQLADIPGLHWIYFKAQFNFLRYVRKLAILASPPGQGLPPDQLPLQNYVASGEDLLGWTTSAGTPDDPASCGLAHRLMGLVEVAQVGADFQVQQIITPQDVQGNLGLIPAATGNHVWYRI